jgi:hypothetical protein
MIQKAAEKINPVIMEIETDPAVCADVARRMDLFERNWDWLEAHASEVYCHRGKFLCISGQELFVGDTVAEVPEAAKAAHPNDDGRFTRYIPMEKGPRIYAY